MKHKRRQNALTLTEMTVIIVTIALMVGLGLPAVRALLKSFESADSAKTMISAALSTARAIAAKEQRYAGIRFQKAYSSEGLLEAPQYMIFVVQDPDIMAWGFRAVEGLKPIKLPDSIGVMDLTIVTDRNEQNPVNPQQEFRLDDPRLTDPERDNLINEPRELADTTTFSVIFSPAGKVVIHGIRVRNRHGRTDDGSNDDIFNTKNNVDAGIGMFYQDDYFGPGWPDISFGPEPSRSNFIIYEREKFKPAYQRGRAWSDYLVRLLPPIYVSPYTGKLISPD